MAPTYPDEKDLISVTSGEWYAVVRRARLAGPVKLACLVVGSYADADGTNIYVGIPRLASDLSASYATAQRRLSWMRQVGLIHLTAKGNARRGLHDMYRLVLSPSIFDKIDIPNPTQYKIMIGRMTENNRIKQRKRAVDNSATQQDPESDQTSSLCEV